MDSIDMLAHAAHDFCKENERLRKELKHKNKVIGEKNKQINDMKEKLDFYDISWTASVDAWNRETSNLKRYIRDRDVKIENYKRSTKGLYETMDMRDADIKRMKEEINRLEADLARANDRVQHLETVTGNQKNLIEMMHGKRMNPVDYASCYPPKTKDPGKILCVVDAMTMTEPGSLYLDLNITDHDLAAWLFNTLMHGDSTIRDTEDDPVYNSYVMMKQRIRFKDQCIKELQGHNDWLQKQRIEGEKENHSLHDHINKLSDRRDAWRKKYEIASTALEQERKAARKRKQLINSFYGALGLDDAAINHIEEELDD